MSRPDPTVTYDQERQLYCWTSVSQTGTAETLSMAWYCAIRDSIPGLVVYHCMGVGDTLQDLIGAHADRALERACRNLPERVTANYLLTLIGWRIKNARRSRTLELRMGSLDALARSSDGIGQALDPSATIDHQQDDTAETVEFRMTLNSIPDPQLRLIAQLLAAGWSKAEVARKLNMAPNGVTRRMERLREALLQLYGEEEGGIKSTGRTLRVRGPDLGDRARVVA